MRVLSSLAIKEAYLELVPAFQAKTGKKVDTEWLGMVDIMKRVKAGESADMVIASQKALAELKSLGKVSVVVDLARSGVAVAVKKGAKRPDIGSAESVKRALRAAKSIAYSSGPSGVHMADVIQKWGLADQLKAKTKISPPDTPVGVMIARGEIEIGFQQVSELLRIKGIDYLGPLPADIDEVTVFSAAVHRNASAPEAAKALVKYLSAPEAAPIIRKTGMDPG